MEHARSLLIDYQTLVAGISTGILAIAAAIIGARALRKQTTEQQRAAERLDREKQLAVLIALKAELSCYAATARGLVKTAIFHGETGLFRHRIEAFQAVAFDTGVPDLFRSYFRDGLLLTAQAALALHGLVGKAEETARFLRSTQVPIREVSTTDPFQSLAELFAELASQADHVGEALSIVADELTRREGAARVVTAALRSGPPTV